MRAKLPVMFYFHNLEWDQQVLWEWLGNHTALRYVEHSARRNGSALTSVWDYPGRPSRRPRVTFRDSLAIWPQSLRDLGHIVGIPKLRTPSEFLGPRISWRDGSVIDSPPDDDDGIPCDEHRLIECRRCYPVNDVRILYAAMSLYIAECNDAHVAPALTRSAHAMRDYRTNYLRGEGYRQYSERQNLRAEEARYGGRAQMVKPGVTVAAKGEVIVQADVCSEYPSIMVQGRFPDAASHHILHRPAPESVRRYVGWAWATVTLPNCSPGPLIYRTPEGRASYPVSGQVQGAWSTDELAYVLDLGGAIEIERLEGTPLRDCVDPFSTFVADKYAARERFRDAHDPREASVKLSMNGLSGKFGMRWTEPMLHFVRNDAPNIVDDLTGIICARHDKMPNRYPDYIMTPWSALIMARGRIMLHKFGMVLQANGAELLCCDTDSWTFRAKRSILNTPLFGDQLGQWKLEPGEATVFVGAAPKEYALYASMADFANGAPYKARAKGVGAVPGDKLLAVSHYLTTGDVWYQTPAKTRSVLHGRAAATFATVHKQRRTAVPPSPPVVLPPPEFRRAVIAAITARHAMTLWDQRHSASLSSSAVG